jgi:hypothetical protein
MLDLQKSIYPSSEYRNQEAKTDDDQPELRKAPMQQAEIKELRGQRKLF